jgi:hypothetical protein
MNRPCSKCDKTLFSCEKSAIGFNQPKGEQLTPNRFVEQERQSSKRVN